jgi:hypothetical protein
MDGRPGHDQRATARTFFTAILYLQTSVYPRVIAINFSTTTTRVWKSRDTPVLGCDRSSGNFQLRPQALLLTARPDLPFIPIDFPTGIWPSTD